MVTVLATEVAGIAADIHSDLYEEVYEFLLKKYGEIEEEDLIKILDKIPN
ncbi:MAG: hypothetical protein ACRCS6_09765 [Turicibacter sp.]